MLLQPAKEAPKAMGDDASVTIDCYSRTDDASCVQRDSIILNPGSTFLHIGGHVFPDFATVAMSAMVIGSSDTKHYTVAPHSTAADQWVVTIPRADLAVGQFIFTVTASGPGFATASEQFTITAIIG